VDEGLRLTPEPTEAERAAVLAALAEEWAEDGSGLDPWSAAALREAVETESEA
jgi:hypothetical protein